MSVLRAIETQDRGPVRRGVRARFRTHVQPVELARKLAKEMDEHRSVSVSRVYVPNEYTLYLSPADREQFASYEGSLVGELQEYLVEHARREGYALLTPPRVLHPRPTTTSRSASSASRRAWSAGRGQRRRPRRRSRSRSLGPLPPQLPRPRRPAATMVYRSREPPPPPAAGRGRRDADARRPPADAADDHGPWSAASRECDIRVDDANVSRRHCELVAGGADRWASSISGSTNGTEVNGQPGRPGASSTTATAITIGSTDARLRAHALVSVAVTPTRRCSASRSAFLVLLYLFVVARRALGDARPRGRRAAGEHHPLRGGGGGASGAGGRLRPIAWSSARARCSSPGRRSSSSSPRASGAAPRTTSASTGTRPSRAAMRRSSSRTDGLWVEDTAPQRDVRQRRPRHELRACSSAGDVIRIGQTDCSWSGAEDRTRGGAHRHRPQAAARTRTPSSATRRCSRSPTGWAARRQASSPRASPPPRSRRRPRGVSDEEGSSASCGPRTPGSSSARCTTRPSPAWGRRPRSRSSTSEAGTLTLGHVGDSRAYRYRDGRSSSSPTDHSLVGELVRSGRLTEAEAAVHPHRSVITRALGTERGRWRSTRARSTSRPATSCCSARTGSRAMVRDEEIAQVLEASAGDPHDAAEALVAAANAAAATTTSRSCCSRSRRASPPAREPPRQLGRRQRRRAADPDAETSETRRRRAAPRCGQGQPLARAAPRPRAPRDRRVRRLVEPGAVSARNRELATSSSPGSSPRRRSRARGSRARRGRLRLAALGGSRWPRSSSSRTWSRAGPCRTPTRRCSR